MGDSGVKKQVIIEITDYCTEPFNDTDLAHFKGEMEDIFADYDIEVTNVKIQEVRDD